MESHAADEKGYIEPKALKAKLEETPGLKLLDVRTQEERRGAHRGAIHMTATLMQSWVSGSRKRCL